MDVKITRRSDYTFKFNKELGRHGWLRLTPAYSVRLVAEIMNGVPEGSFILDPFSGTGTTGLVAAERGLFAHCFDINPFLVWLGNVKCRNYTSIELKKLDSGIRKCLLDCKRIVKDDNWIPDIHNINRWWSGRTLRILSALRQSLVNQFGEPKANSASSLAWIAFCRLAIETSSAAFNHVSMSFHDKAAEFNIDQMESIFLAIFDAIVSSIEHLSDDASIHFGDSTNPFSINDIKYSHVITSPPYPNRISYIRELRPYMYWTKFLDTARAAGELDWKTIGGTWGIATSRLQNWEPGRINPPQFLELVSAKILESKGKNARLMATYVKKYFYDMHLHLCNLRGCLKRGAILSYIVGNSSFYDVQIHTEKLFEESLTLLGFTNIGSRVVRKRNSKKELYEYCVYATWKENGKYEPRFFNTVSKNVKQENLL